MVPIGDTGTIPFAMRKDARDFVDVAFDTKEGSGPDPPDTKEGSDHEETSAASAADGGTSTRGP